MTTTRSAGNEELARARAALATAGCNFSLLSSLANVTYASGWEVPVPIGALAELAYGPPLLLCAAREPAAWLIVPNASADTAGERAGVDAVVPFDTFDSFVPTDSRGSYLDRLRETLRQAGLTGATGTLAVEGGSLPHVVGAMLAAELPRWTLIDDEAVLRASRSVTTTLVIL